MQPLLNIVLFQPEIPQNTGNIGRMCAITGTRLHLIYPLGFNITTKQLRRSGMDYWEKLDVHHHEDWDAFEKSERPERIHLLTTKGSKSIWELRYKKGDYLLFGSEGAGCPDWIHEKVSSRLKIPHFQEGLRSLNLATSAGIATYEALRQITAKSF